MNITPIPLNQLKSSTYISFRGIGVKYLAPNWITVCLYRGTKKSRLFHMSLPVLDSDPSIHYLKVHKVKESPRLIESPLLHAQRVELGTFFKIIYLTDPVSAIQDTDDDFIPNFINVLQSTGFNNFKVMHGGKIVSKWNT